jgi:hypothetical protein
VKKKLKRVFLVVDGDRILYRTKREYVARAFQNGYGVRTCQILKARVQWAAPDPAASRGV